MKRAARNDGWSCAGAAFEDLVAMVKKVASFRADYGRTGDFRIFESDMGEVTYDDVRRKEDAGVTDLILFFRNIYTIGENLEPISEKIDRFKKFSDEVMARASKRA